VAIHPLHCTRQDVQLNRGDRVFISWPVTGLTDTTTASVSLEGGPFITVDVAVGEVVGYFAGPDFPLPGAARVVPTTSHAMVRIMTDEIQETFDGGFIWLV
jgi:hypothetical protein